MKIQALCVLDVCFSAMTELEQRLDDAKMSMKRKQVDLERKKVGQ